MCVLGVPRVFGALGSLGVRRVLGALGMLGAPGEFEARVILEVLGALRNIFHDFLAAADGLNLSSACRSRAARCS